MSSFAHQTVVPIRPDLQVVEQRVADLDDGYVRLATMILEELAGGDFTKRQYKVILAVIRLTYGWNKPRDRIANSQISEITKLPVKRVSETRVQLLKMNVLSSVGQHIGINKNVSEWCLPQIEGKSPKMGDEDSLKLREIYPLKQGHTIDIIPKTVKTTNTPVVPPQKKTVKAETKSTQIPEDFKPSESHQVLAAELGVNLDREFSKFVDYNLAKGNEYKRWDSALNNWLRKSAEYSGYGREYKRGIQHTSKPMNHIPEGFTG